MLLYVQNDVEHVLEIIGPKGKTFAGRNLLGMVSMLYTPTHFGTNLTDWKLIGCSRILKANPTWAHALQAHCLLIRSNR